MTVYTPITFIFVLVWCKHSIYVARLPPAERNYNRGVLSLFLPNSVKNDIICELISGVGVSQICHGMVVGGREVIDKDR